MWEFLEDFDPRWIRSHPYALVDATWRDEVPASWNATVIAPTFLGQDTSRCPVLLDLSQLPQSELPALMDRVGRQAVDREDGLFSLMLASSLPHGAVAAHLARRMVVTAPGADTPKQWRFFDPGTFLQMPSVLGPQGLAWLLGPVEAVLVPWAGHWTRLSRPSGESTGFRLQPGHLAALSRVGVINRALLQRRPPTDSASWMHACARLDDTVRRAVERHGLRVQSDLVTFAGHAIDHHPRFDDHARIQALLGALRAAKPEDEIDYEGLTASLSAADWLAICRELPAADPITAFTEEGSA